jgi:phage-related protein
MKIFLRRLIIRNFDPTSNTLDCPDNSWKVYSICETAKIQSCSTFSDIGALGSEDKRNARSSYISFLNRANTGQLISELFDEKQCHPTHTFKLGNKEVKIWRVWLAGVIRINFCYLPNKSIVVLKTWTKRKNKLSKSDKSQLENIALQVLNTDTEFIVLT